MCLLWAWVLFFIFVWITLLCESQKIATCVFTQRYIVKNKLTARRWTNTKQWQITIILHDISTQQSLGASQTPISAFSDKCNQDKYYLLWGNWGTKMVTDRPKIKQHETVSTVNSHSALAPSPVYFKSGSEKKRLDAWQKDFGLCSTYF